MRDGIEKEKEKEKRKKKKSPQRMCPPRDGTTVIERRTRCEHERYRMTLRSKPKAEFWRYAVAVVFTNVVQLGASTRAPIGGRDVNLDFWR